MLLVFCILTLSYQFLMELNNQYLLTHCCKKHQRSEGKWQFQALLAAIWEKIMIIVLNAFTRVHFCWKEINWVIRFFISCRHMSFTVHTGFFSAEGCLLFGWQTLRLQCHRQRLGLYQQHLNIRFQWIQWKLGCMNIHIYRERDGWMDVWMDWWVNDRHRQTDRQNSKSSPSQLLTAISVFLWSICSSSPTPTATVVNIHTKAEEKYIIAVFLVVI